MEADFSYRASFQAASSFTRATAELPENVLKLSVTRRTWNGVGVDVAEWHGAGIVTHRFPYEAKTRLVTLLEETGNSCEPRLRANKPSPFGYNPKHMNFAPADMEMWGFSADARFVKDATLTFDLVALAERMATQFDPRGSVQPKLCFSDDRLWALVKMLSEVVDHSDPSSQLYGDGLTAAIAARLFTWPAKVAKPTGLAPWQLRRVIERLESSLPDRVELADLAALAGLSQSHFSRAFKISTGMAPYRWQLDARIRLAQAMLIKPRVSLADVAEATGFADEVHFGRTFRKLTGATPAAWRRSRAG
jgi:AraC-like DNA-binding protein